MLAFVDDSSDREYSRSRQRPTRRRRRWTVLPSRMYCFLHQTTNVWNCLYLVKNHAVVMVTTISLQFKSDPAWTSVSARCCLYHEIH